MDYSKLNKLFAVIHPWGMEAPSAEKEVSKRLNKAAKNIGATCIHLNKIGNILDSNYMDTGIHVSTLNNVSFIFHHHFSSCKWFDGWHVFPLWNPPAIPYDWKDATFHIANYLQYDDYLKSTGEFAEKHLQMLLNTQGWFDNGILHLYPTLPKTDYLEPKPIDINTAKIFYVGMAWEQSAGLPIRHDNIFRKLDRKDCISIYGPEKIGEHKTWVGYKNYLGEIPFDGGYSLLRTINESGIALALSSLKHQKAEIMSNRLWESAAAGAVIITDRNSFVEKYFGDSVLMVENRGDENETYEQIYDAYKWIIENPKDAYKKAISCQEVYLSNFTLEKYLDSYFEALPKRMETRGKILFSQNQEEPIDVVILWTDDSLDEFDNIILSVNRQSYRSLNLILIMDEFLYQDAVDLFENNLRKNITYKVINYHIYNRGTDKESLNYRNVTTGQLLEVASSYITNNYISFLNANELWFRDHLAILKRRFENNNHIQTSYVIGIKACYNKSSISHYARDHADEYNAGTLWNKINLHNQIGRVVIRKSYWDSLLEENFLDACQYIDHLEFVPLMMKSVVEGTADFCPKSTYTLNYYLTSQPFNKNSYEKTIYPVVWQTRFIESYLSTRYGKYFKLTCAPKLLELERKIEQLKVELLNNNSLAADTPTLVRNLPNTIIQQTSPPPFNPFKRLKRKLKALMPMNKADIMKHMDVIRNSIYWDEDYYENMYPDITDKKISLLEHFVRTGWREGRNPSSKFDVINYLNNYEDVKNSGMNPLYHYIVHGETEGRLPK